MTEELEDTEILVIYYSIPLATKKHLVKSKLPSINMFYCEVLTVVSVMCDLTVGVFENIDITFKLDIDKVLNIH